MEKDVIIVEDHSTVMDAMTEIAQPTDTTQVAQIADAVPEAKPDEIPVPEKPADKKKDYVTDDYIDAATETAIALIDNVQEMCFTIAANSKKKDLALKLVPENGVTRLMQLRAEKKANKSGGNVEIVNNYSGDDAKLLHVDSVIEDFIDQLPFTPKQIKNMKPGLKIMVEKNAGKIPPELLFFLGLATAIGGNIAEYKSL
jgi:hypothetical protein